MPEIHIHRNGRGPRPTALPRIGLFHLGIPGTLVALNATAGQFLQEGLPVAVVDPVRCPAYVEDGSPAQADGLAVWECLHEQIPTTSVLRLERRGQPGEILVSSAAPLFAVGGTLVGVSLSAVLCPPEPDWETLAGLAHDMRTPLQALRLLMPVLAGMPLPGVAPDVLARVGRSADRLGELGEEVVDWCRSPALGAARSGHAWAELGPLLRSALAEQQPAGQARGVRLVWDGDAAEGVAMHTEPGQLSRLLANLLSNGVRYTGKGGEVRLSASWRNGPGCECLLVLEVVDTGAGMAEDDGDSIFQPFQRGSAGQGTGGSGVGLAVVDRLVHELGLSLEVTSETGRGSQFSVVVPAALLRVG